VAGFGLILGKWYRNPLRRQMQIQPIAYRTELDRVKFPDPSWWVSGDETRGMWELIIRGDIVRVGSPFWLVMGPQCYFRAPETTIELSRNFLEDVWNALVAAGAVPTSAGPEVNFHRGLPTRG